MSVRLTAMAAFVATLATHAHAAVIYVKADAAGLNNGSSWINAYRRLQPALAAANSGDQIWIAAGTYKPTAMLTPFTLPSGVKLYGGFAGGEASPDERDWVANLCILDADLLGDDGPNFANRADNARTILELNNAAIGTRIDGLVFRGGYADTTPFNFGGAISLISGYATIENCLFVGNSGNLGGAVACISADEVRIRNCVFTLNRAAAGSGGALYFLGETSLIENCQFAFNSASGATGSLGGGAYVSADSIRVIDSQFASNVADGVTAGGGGGLRVSCESPETIDISGCTFTANQSVGGTGGTGGGLDIYHASTGSLRLAACTFSRNDATGGTAGLGGAVSAWVGQLDAVNCDFIENTATDLGGALMHYGSQPIPIQRISGCQFLGNASASSPAIDFNADDDGLFTLTNSIVAGNRGERYNVIRVEGSVDVDNCTIAYNSMTIDLAASTLSFTDDQSTIDNTIFWGNEAAGVVNQDIQFSAIIAAGNVNHSCVSGWDGTLGGLDNFDVDPLFVDPDGADNVLGTEDDLYTLRPFSPCIDAGNNAPVPADLLDLDADGDVVELLPLDIYDRARFIDDIDVADTGSGTAPIVDIGAVELQRRSCPADLTQDGILNFFDVQEFLNLYAAGDPAVDFTSDGNLDFFDVLLFLGFFDAGCP